MKIRAQFTTYGVFRQVFEFEILDEELRQFTALWDNFTLYDALNYAKGIGGCVEAILIDKQYPLYCQLQHMPASAETSETRMPGAGPDNVLGQLREFAADVGDGAMELVVKAGIIIGVKKVKDEGGVPKSAPVRDLASQAINDGKGGTW